MPTGEGEVGDAELRDQRGARPGDRELPLGALDRGGVVQVIHGMGVSPLRSEEELPDLCVGQHRVGGLEGSQHRAGTIVVRVLERGGCHVPIPAEPTDIARAQNPVSTGS